MPPRNSSQIKAGSRENSAMVVAKVGWLGPLRTAVLTLAAVGIGCYVWAEQRLQSDITRKLRDANHQAVVRSRELRDETAQAMAQVREQSQSLGRLFKLRETAQVAHLPNNAAMAGPDRRTAVKELGSEIVYWAQISWNANGEPKLERSASSETASAWITDPQAFEANMLRELAKSANAAGGETHLAETGFRLRWDTDRKAEGWGIWTSSPDVHDVQAGRGARVGWLALIAPEHFLSALGLNPDSRTYWIGDDGHVFFHGQSHYTHTEFGRTGVFTQRLLPSSRGEALASNASFAASNATASGASGNAYGLVKSIDQQPVLASYSRLDGIPAGVAVEVAFPTGQILAASDESAVYFDVFGRGATLAGVLLVAQLGWSFQRRRKRKASGSPEEATAADDLSFAVDPSILAVTVPTAGPRATSIAASEIGGEPTIAPILDSASTLQTALNKPSSISVPPLPVPPRPVPPRAPVGFGVKPTSSPAAEKAALGATAAQPSAQSPSSFPNPASNPNREPLVEFKVTDTRVQQAMSDQQDHQVSLDSLRRELSAAKGALQAYRNESELINRFEAEAYKLKEPRAVADRLVDAAARICHSPALFFAYDERIRTLFLQADGGFNLRPSAHGMSTAFDQTVIDDILAADSRGEIPSLAKHAGLSKLLLNGMGVAHFEAWAVTGFGHWGRVAGKAKVLGVLVVLESGIDSLVRRDSLSRMMRTTGLVYENALLSR